MLGALLFILAATETIDRDSAQDSAENYSDAFISFFACHEAITSKGLNYDTLKNMGWQEARTIEGTPPTVLLKNNNLKSYLTITALQNHDLCIVSSEILETSEFNDFLNTFGKDLPPVGEDGTTGFRAGHRLITFELAHIEEQMFIKAYVVNSPITE